MVSHAPLAVSRNGGNYPLGTVRDRDFNEILKFLQHAVPREAEKAKQSLQVFDECHQALRLELEITQGAVLAVRPGVVSDAYGLWNRRKLKLQASARRY